MSSLPVALTSAVQAILRAAGDDTPLRSTRVVSGGCINHTTRLETERRAYLLKWNPAVQPGFFDQEARGLCLLAATQTVRVPEVYASEGDLSEDFPQPPAMILLEWLEPDGDTDPARLGEQLAALHRHDRIPAGLTGFSPLDTPAYGLDHDNYLGSAPQPNTWLADWPEFYARCRLEPQMRLAAKAGHLNVQRRKSLERMIDRIPNLLSGVQRQPALIHGDLWSGNVIPGPGGLALIDPAVSFSDREAELAYTELFGGFSTRFYAAYQQNWPLAHGYTQRRDIYILYHLLNHLNLFGEGYGSAVDAILQHYA